MSAALPSCAPLCAGLALLVAGCDLPRDADNTTEQIEARGTIRLGLIAGATLEDAARSRLEAAARRMGARVRVERGEGEDLLRRLQEGQFDLVYGNLAASSPWSAEVHIGTVPGRRTQPPGDLQMPRFAFRNGENGWIMAMERIEP